VSLLHLPLNEWIDNVALGALSEYMDGLKGIPPVYWQKAK
jgi:hypothetical protein